MGIVIRNTLFSFCPTQQPQAILSVAKNLRNLICCVISSVAVGVVEKSFVSLSFVLRSSRRLFQTFFARRRISSIFNDDPLSIEPFKRGTQSEPYPRFGDDRNNDRRYDVRYEHSRLKIALRYFHKHAQAPRSLRKYFRADYRLDIIRKRRR